MKPRSHRDFSPASAHVRVTSGAVIRMLRELKGWTQEELAGRCGISGTNISLLENDRVTLGKKRAEMLAEAFDVHPALIMFPEHEARAIGKAA